MIYSSFISYLNNSIKNYSGNDVFIIRRKIRREKIKYRDLPILLSRLEKFFKKNKIKPQDKVLLWGMNCPEYSILLAGCFSFARIAVPIDYRTSPTTIEAIIDTTYPKFAFVSKYLRYEFLKKRKIKIFFIEDLIDDIEKIGKSSLFSIYLKNKIYTNPNQISEIVFTSGTTGIPKGVVLRQKAILANLLSAKDSLPDLTRGRIISILPLSHMFEQIVGLLIPLGFGAAIYYLPRINSFRILSAFAEYKPTHQIFVPQLLKIIWAKVEEQAIREGSLEKLKKALRVAAYLPQFMRKIIFGKIHRLFGGSLKLIACGGAPLDPEIGRNWILCGIPVVEGYGATEVTAIATFNPVNRVRLGTVGKPIDGVEITIDQNKEIYIKSPAISDGYYGEKEKTGHSFGPLGFKTGDIGEIDCNGYLRIIGRDAFKIVLPSGEKVYVEDLESQIMKDIRVKEACVVGKIQPDGDRIHAYFILNEHVKDKLSHIVAGINLRLESKQQITSFEIYEDDDFPRTHTLKIDRAYMHALVNADKEKVPASALSIPSNYYDILDILAKISGFNKDRIMDSDLLTTDLGLDSLSRVELVSLAEEYLGIILDETQINSKTKVSDIKNLVKKAKNTESVLLPSWQFTWWGQFLHEAVLRFILLPFHSYIIKMKFTRSIPYIPSSSIIIFNHPGIMDGVCVLRILQKQRNLKVVTNATSSVWEKKSILAPIGELLIGGLPLYETGQKLYQVLQTDSDLLDKGYNLLFAPAGTMQRGEMENPFLPGIGYLVKELDRSVTIVKILGYREIWPAPKEDIANAKFRDLIPHKRGTVEVRVSKPISENWEKMSIMQIANLLEERYKAL